MHVEHAAIGDLPRLQEAYAAGRRRQRDHGTLVWPEFSGESLVEEVRERRLLRVMDDAAMVGTFVVAYDDRAIWGDLERGAHVYLHRLARSPGRTSPGLVECVVDWASTHCRELRREGIRIDTAAESTQLVAYYERAGFAIVGHRVIEPDADLPPHYHGTELALFEMPVSAD